MSKNLLQDMVKIKRLNRPTQMTSPKEIPLEREFLVKNSTQNNTHNVRGRQENSRTRHTLWIVVIISLVFFLFTLSNLFLKAVVTVNPKMKNVSLNENLSARKDSNTDDLSFNLMVIESVENKIIKANSEKDVSEKATGTVVIYNAFSSSSQPLSIDTRLIGSNGKIYKTKIKTVVPGMDKKRIPGSVEVKIYASEAGAQYNSIPLDFNIVGFKETPKYLKIYARSKGEITGGFVGKAPAVSEAEQATAINDLKTALHVKLLQKATSQIPTGFILFKNAIFLNTDDSNISSTYNKDNSMTLTLKGTLNGILLDEQKLTKKIVGDTIDKYDGSNVYIPNIRALTFSLSNSNRDSISLGNVGNIDFNLSGVAKIVWKLDENKLLTDLLSKSKKDFNQILLQYPNIDSADLVISPFWKISLPGKTKNIKMIVNYPK